MIREDLKKKGNIDIEKIADKVVTVPGQSIDNYTRADIIIRLARGETFRAISASVGVSTPTINVIKTENLDLLDMIRKDIAIVNVEKEQKLINKFLDILDIKADRMAGDDDIIDTTKTTEISTTIKDLHNKMLLDQGRATSITEYKNKSEGELLAELKEATILLEQGDKKALLTAVFNNEE